jgi:DedD protein
MARAISDEEIQLRKRARRRLGGAVILVAVVVVLLPMVLDSEPKPESQDINIRIPAPDATPFSPQVAPAPAVKPEAKSDVVATAPAAKTAPTSRADKPEPRPEPPAKAPKPAAEPSLKAATDKAQKTAADKAQKAAAEPAKPKSQDYVLQVIALADADRAKQMQRQIAAAGIKSYTEVVDTAKGPVTRVRVGPFASQEAAEKARAQLQGIGLDGKVVPR